MGSINLLTKLKADSSALVLGNKSEFPTDPTDGQLTNKNGVVFVYSTIDGVTTWFPLNNNINIVQEDW